MDKDKMKPMLFVARDSIVGFSLAKLFVLFTPFYTSPQTTYCLGVDNDFCVSMGMSCLKDAET